MAAQVFRIEDYRPPPVGVASLYLNACFQIWKGVAMLAAIPLAVFIKGRP